MDFEDDFVIIASLVPPINSRFSEAVWTVRIEQRRRVLLGHRSDSENLAEFSAGFGYTGAMSIRPLTDRELAESRQRLAEAMNLQAIEGNPLSEEDVAMFEMFERERWPHERCIRYIIEQTQGHAQAAE